MKAANKMEETELKLLVIGGSAGSLDVLLNLMPSIVPDKSSVIIIVLHRRDDYDSPLADLLSYSNEWQVYEAEDKVVMKPGMVILAPANYHLLVEKDGTISLDASERVNFSRPSIDITFETAADAYGSNVACLLLSGANSDGVKGLRAAGRFGATVLVQDPDTAIVDYMPRQAINEVDVHHILKPEEMAAFIQQFFARF